MERLGTKKINVRSTSQEWREVGWDGKKKGGGQSKNVLEGKSLQIKLN